MDEPTNHLDIPARESVEEAMDAFPGTILLVSHDRYLIDRIADRVLVFEQEGLVSYPGNYSDYKAALAAMQPETAQPAVAAPPRTVKNERAEKKNTSPLKRRQDCVRQMNRAEKEIGEMETVLAELECRINDPASHADPVQSRELGAEHERVKVALEEAYRIWEELGSALEALDSNESEKS